MTSAGPDHLRGVNAHVHELTITEASRHLGVSTATIKRRLAKGELKGRQVPRPQGFLWLIEVDQDQGNTPTATTADAALITTLRDQVAILVEELAGRRREVQELHVLLQTAQTALNAAPARPWWRFW